MKYLYSLWKVSGQHANITWKKPGTATSSRLGYTAGLWRIKAGTHTSEFRFQAQDTLQDPSLCSVHGVTQHRTWKEEARERCQHLNSASLQRHCKVNAHVGEYMKTTATVQKLFRVLMESRDE